MKKRTTLLTTLLLVLAIGISGCGKTDASVSTQEKVTLPDSAVGSSAGGSTEAPAEPVAEVPEAPAVAVTDPAVPWDQVYDYSSDHEKLSADGALKNLTIQLGNAQNELHVTWFSTAASGGSVVFEKDSDGSDFSSGTTFTASTKASISVPGYHQNRADVTDLEPATRYHYRIGNEGTWSPTYAYTTPDFNADEFTFTITSDQELGLGDEEDNVLAIHSEAWRLALNRIQERLSDSAFIFSLGDQVAVPEAPEEYDEFLDKSVLYSHALLPIVGNHDVGTGSWGDHFYPPNISPIGTSQGDDGDYWFRYNNVLFMVVNTCTDQPKDCHEEFVAQAIAANEDAKWRVVVGHYSPVSNVEKYQGSAQSIRDSFFYMQDTFDIDLFLSGHDHSYSRSYVMDYYFEETDGTETSITNPGGALYMVFSTSTGCIYRDPYGAEFTGFAIQNNQPQVSQAHVTDTSFTITTYDADTWDVVDSYTINKD